MLAGVAASWLWRVVPDGIRPPAVSASAWRELLTHPALMAVVAVTALQSAGQFGVQAYLAPYYRQQLGADATTISLLFFWTGLCGLIGNVLTPLLAGGRVHLWQGPDMKALAGLAGQHLARRMGWVNKVAAVMLAGLAIRMIWE